MALIYIIEDDDALKSELANLLALRGYEVASCENFQSAAEDVLAAAPDLVLLDLKLPSADGRVNGHSICRTIRTASDVPVVILTSVNSEFDEVMAMGLGAHDYITKPYRPAVLLARIEALLRRYGEADRKEQERIHKVEHGGLTLDLNSSMASYGGRSALLTRNEQHILALLLENPGTIISRQEIMCDLWESDAFIDDNTLTVNVNRLRKTLADLGVPEDFLKTRRGQGYVI